MSAQVYGKSTKKKAPMLMKKLAGFFPILFFLLGYNRVRSWNGGEKPVI